MRGRSGFTLIEILLVIAITAIIAGLSTSFYRSFQIDEELDVTTKDLLQVLRDAQNRSITGLDDVSWGVNFDNDNYCIFQGDAFLNCYDDAVEFNNDILTIETDFGSEIYFTKITGAPSDSGTLTIRAESDSLKTIEINSAGLISLSS